MASTLKRLSYWGVFVAGSFSILFFNSVSFSAEPASTDATLITCPPEIKDLRLSYTTRYLPPRGWGRADAHQSRMSKGGVINNVTLALNGHGMDDRNLICRYGAESSGRRIHLAAIKQLIPRGVSCILGPDYSFQCDDMDK